MEITKVVKPFIKSGGSNTLEIYTQTEIEKKIKNIIKWNTEQKNKSKKKKKWK